MRILLIVVSAGVLSSCAFTTGVIPMGGDTYMISASRKGFINGSEVKVSAIQEAYEFCSKDGKELEVIKTEQQDMKPFRTDAYAEVQFRCSDKKK